MASEDILESVRNLFTDEEASENILQSIRNLFTDEEVSDSIDSSLALRGDYCSICNELMLYGHLIAMSVECRHGFHAHCLRSWSIRSRRPDGRVSCPNCRARVLFILTMIPRLSIPDELEEETFTTCFRCRWRLNVGQDFLLMQPCGHALCNRCTSFFVGYSCVCGSIVYRTHFASYESDAHFEVLQCSTMEVRDLDANADDVVALYYIHHDQWRLNEAGPSTHQTGPSSSAGEPAHDRYEDDDDWWM